MGRVQQPALDREGITGPMDGFGFTPRRLEAVVVVGDRMRRLPQRAEINLGAAEKELLIYATLSLATERLNSRRPSPTVAEMLALPAVIFPLAESNSPDINLA